MNQLICFGLVKSRDQAHYKVLRQLRASGVVRIGPGKGFWSLTDQAAATLGTLRRLIENEARWRA